MPSRRPHYDDFADMPAGMRDFLLSDDFDARAEAFQKETGLPKDRVDAVTGKVIDVAFNDLALPQALTDLKALLVPSTLPEETWASFTAAFIKTFVWPLRELFGDELTDVLRAENLNPSSWPSARVILKPLTYSGAASEIAASVGFSLMSPQSRERLRDLVMTRYKGIRVDAQVREVLIRAADFGGLGMDAAMADRTLDAIKQLIGNVKIMSEEEYSNWLAEEEQRQEAAATISVAAEPASVATPNIRKDALDLAVDDIASKLQTPPLDDYLTKRLHSIISSRLRDVRSAFEMKQLLERDSKVGGMGFTRDQADAVAASIELGYKTSHDKIMEEERKKLDQQLMEQKQKIEERRKREAEEHAQWYKEKIQAKQQAAEQQTQAATRVKQAYAGQTVAAPAHPIDLKATALEKERFGELVPTEHPDVKVSKATVELQAAVQAGKPRLEDVKTGAAQLMGPIQELKTFSLSEFRRLGKDPEQAARKIMQLLETLGQESLERKIEGIQAWQQSPLQKSYMDLVSASFRTGKPVVTVSEEMRAAGQDVLSPAEIASVISLNSKLHF